MVNVSVATKLDFSEKTVRVILSLTEFQALFDLLYHCNYQKIPELEPTQVETLDVLINVFGTTKLITEVVRTKNG